MNGDGGETPLGNIKQPTGDGGAVGEIPCISCAKLGQPENKLEVKVPGARIFNGPDVSIIAFAHEKLDICPHCKSKYLCLIRGFDQNGTLEFKWVKVEPRQPPSTITPGSDEEMKKALIETEMLKAMKTERKQ